MKILSHDTIQRKICQFVLEKALNHSCSTEVSLKITKSYSLCNRYSICLQNEWSIGESNLLVQSLYKHNILSFQNNHDSALGELKKQLFIRTGCSITLRRCRRYQTNGKGMFLNLAFSRYRVTKLSINVIYLGTFGQHLVLTSITVMQWRFTEESYFFVRFHYLRTFSVKSISLFNKEWESVIKRIIYFKINNAFKFKGTLRDSHTFSYFIK